jgi:hypothetical protein
MQISALAHVLLKLMFTVSSARAPLSRPRLEQQTGRARGEVNRALAELAAAGLIDAQRLRLTLSGLALAVASGARSKSRTRVAAARLRPDEPAIRAPIALFSRREPPRAVA